MRYAFHILDVFTRQPFGGNQLAVLPDAQGLGPRQMQSIAAEFNFSETTFVLPADLPDHDCRVRIFTPRAEIPFAGHPTIGTALVLARLGRISRRGETGRVLMEQLAGSVPVTIAFQDDRPDEAELTAPAAIQLGPGIGRVELAAMVNLAPGDIGDVQVASAGAPFMLAEVVSLQALSRARSPAVEAAAGIGEAGANGILLFTRDTGDPAFDLRARMFAPLHGIPEDPATGSAAAALAGLLAGKATGDGWHGWRICQGVEMGRPSLLKARARRQGTVVSEIRVAGAAVPMAEGWIDVPGEQEA